MSVIPPSIPENAAENEWVGINGGPLLRVYTLNSDVTDGPALLWGHANGFSAGSYLPWLQRIAKHMRVFAFDARGHGGSEPPGEPLAETCQADTLAWDLAAVTNFVLNRIGLHQVLHFAAHSYTGLFALRLGAVHDMTPWHSTTLFEPPLSPTPDEPNHAIAQELAGQLISGALRRRNAWANPEALLERLSGSSAYAAWDREMMEVHCHAILHPAANGDGYVLACDPAVEAAGYQMTLDSSTYASVDKFDCPTTFIVSDLLKEGGTPSWASRVQGLAANRVPGARLVQVPDTGHMMIFEKPDECLRLLFESIDAANATRAARG
ncbi:MAG: alpha/beta fold hydrolase [Alphaproteobacteria bacterium]|jgi:pimeloyl-ACP methyl ester carboxylesterase